MVEVFINHNMVEAKRKIKKQLAQNQKLIEEILDREIKEGNRILKKFIDQQLKGWEAVNGQKFDLAYIDFEQEVPKI